MSVYIYLFNDRLIYAKDYNPFYKVVRRLAQVKWYAVHGELPLPVDEMIRQENYSYNMRDGFFTLSAELPKNWGERGDVIRKIQILEKFNALSNTQKLNYTDSNVGQALADVLVVDEIRRYQATKSLDGCAILTSYLETGEADLTPEAMVTKLWLKYESYAQLVANLNRLEYNIRQMLNMRKFDEASNLLAAEFEKIRM